MGTQNEYSKYSYMRRTPLGGMYYTVAPSIRGGVTSGAVLRPQPAAGTGVYWYSQIMTS